MARRLIEVYLHIVFRRVSYGEEFVSLLEKHGAAYDACHLWD